jgi:hypothetical protein
MDDPFALIILLLGTIAVLAAALSGLWIAWSSRALRAEVRKIEKSRSENKPDVSALLSSSGLRTYYFLDEGLVSSLHVQLRDSDLIMTERQTEQTLSRERALTASTKRLGGSFKRGATGTRKDSYKVDLQPDLALAEVENMLVSQNQITLIDVDQGIDSRGYMRLSSTLDNLRRSIGFELSDGTVSTIDQEWRDFQAKEGRLKLSRIAGFVVVDGDFVVSNDTSGDLVLTRSLMNGSDALRVKAVCKEDGVRSVGHTALQSGQHSRVTCMGRVVRWDDEHSTLFLLALAVF